MLHRVSHFCGEANTAEVCQTLWWKILRCMLHRRSYSPIYATSRKSLLRCMLHRGSHFCGVCYIAEVTSAVYATPCKSLLRCSIHCRSLLNVLVKISTVNATLQKLFPGVCYIAEVTSAVYATPRKWCYTAEVILVTFADSLSLINEFFMSYKELTWANNIGKFQFDFQKLLKSEKKNHFRAVCYSAKSFKKFEYCRKYEFLRKKLFPRKDQGRGAIDWRNKKNSKKSHVSVPLSVFFRVWPEQKNITWTNAKFGKCTQNRPYSKKRPKTDYHRQCDRNDGKNWKSYEVINFCFEKN